MARLGIHCIVVYVDDFMIIASTESEAWRVYFSLRALLRSLGFAVNMKPHKTIFPSQICNFLGICLDSVGMKARSDDAKLAATLALLDSILRKGAVKTAELRKRGREVKLDCSNRIWRSHLFAPHYQRHSFCLTLFPLHSHFRRTAAGFAVVPRYLTSV